MFNFKAEHMDQAKLHFENAKRITVKTAKYGLIFTSGVLVGTICGVVLFFKIGNDPI